MSLHCIPVNQNVLWLLRSVFFIYLDVSVDDQRVEKQKERVDFYHGNFSWSTQVCLIRLN